MRVLLVMPDPLDVAPLAGAEEQQAMREAIAFHATPIEVVQLYPPTWRHLRQALLDNERFDVIHFVGHGNSAEILLEAEDGLGERVGASALATELTQHGVQLIVLNVCESELPARALVEAGLPAAIGTTYAIDDSQAICLTRDLYGTLAAGQTLAESMHQIRLGLAGDADPKADTIPICFGDESLHFTPSDQQGIPQIQILRFPTVTGYLPQIQRFFGRRPELFHGLQLLADPYVNTIQTVGLGGAGKTSFGGQLVQRGAWHFFGIVWFALKQQATSIEALLLEKLGPLLGAESVEDVLRQLDNLALLLIFDDAECLLTGPQHELASFLQRIPYRGGSKVVLLTSTPLSFVADNSGSGLIHLSALDEESILSYLLYCAYRQGNAELQSAPDNVQRKFAVLFALQPAFIELAVDFAQKVGLEKALTVFDELPVPWVERMEIFLRPTLTDLSEDESRLLRMSAVFAGPASAEWLMDATQPPADQAALLKLLGRHLVQKDRWGHYVVPPLIKAYLTQGSADSVAIFLRHACFLAEKALRWKQESAPDYGFSCRNEFAAILPEAVLAVERCKAIDEVEAHRARLDLASGLRDYLHFQRRDWQAVQLFDGAAVQASQTLDDMSGLGAALVSLGAAQVTIDLVKQGHENCEQGIRHLTLSGDKRALSIAYGALGYIERKQMESAKALDSYAKALALAVEIGDLSLAARHRSNLGSTYRMIGDLERAETHCQDALTTARQTDNQYLIASQLDMLGHIARLRDDFGQSIQYHQQAYWIKKRLNDTVGLRMTLTMLASTFKKVGRAGDVIDELEAIFDDLENQADPLQRWLLLLQIARLRRVMGHWGIAIDAYKEALTIAQGRTYFKGISICERGIGLCFKARGDIESARKHLQKALDVPSDASYQEELLKELQDLQRAQ